LGRGGPGSTVLPGYYRWAAGTCSCKLFWCSDAYSICAWQICIPLL